MKRLFSLIIITAVILVFSMGNTPSVNSISYSPAEEREDSVQSALVDMVADIIEKRGKNDSTIYLIGNVIFHHNGAIIQCDSAKKYSSNSMDFFGHVLINKDSAYIYGDKASYDGKTSTAEVFAPIVKMMRGTASLYTQNLTFNTEHNIGYFTNGGLIIHNDTNHMESLEGEYNSNTNEIIFKRNVAIHNPSYTAKSDSLKYNLDQEVITLLTNTTIWTKNNDILEAETGKIYTTLNYCIFNRDSYILSASNEIWADTIKYETDTKRATLMSNVQIIDTVERAIGFGDWGLWDDSLQNAILTRKPSIISYSSDLTDTLYLRADSLIMTTGIDTTGLKRGEEPVVPMLQQPTDSLKAEPIQPDSLQQGDSTEISSIQLDSARVDSLITHINQIDTTNTGILGDTTAKDSLPRLLRGFRNVRGWSHEYQFRCDSLVGHTIDSTGSLIGKPVLWNEENQLIAELIDVYTADGKLDWADLTGEPILAQKVRPIHPVLEDSMRYNQAAGNTMQVYFTDNELDSAIMQGNVHNIYWMDHKGFTAAIADITCADLTIFFKNRSLRRMKWNGNVDWKIYPLEKVDPKQEKYLPKFEWLDSIRPKSEKDISNRIIKPSRRGAVLCIPRPRFFTEHMLLSKMKQAIEEGKWVDRNDKTNVTPGYFLTH